MSPRVSVNGAGLVVGVLKRHGIRHVFGVPGAQVAALMDGFSRDDYFRYIICRHEEVAAHMAHGVGRTDSEMALCFGTTGPGSTNMVSAVQSAAMDNTPMLVITANNPSCTIYPFKDYLQDSNNVRIFGAFAKYSEQVSQSERLEELLERAIYHAKTGKPGPAHVDIPVDFLYHENNPRPHTFSGTVPVPPAPGAAALGELNNLLRDAEKPLFMIGGGVLRAGAENAMQALIDRLQVPVSTTVNGRGAINTDSDLCVGPGGLFGGVAYEAAVKEADLIIAVGCKFGSFSLVSRSDDFNIARGQKLVQVDIDSAVIGRNTPVTLGIVADAREFAETFLARLPQEPHRDWSDWRSYLKQRKEEHKAAVSAAMADCGAPEGVLPQAQVAERLEQLLPADAMVAVDGGQVAMWANTLLTPHDRLSIVYTPGTGHLGSGFPMAMGLALAKPDRPAFVITGDGAFTFTAQDLATCQKYGIPVIVIVLHDACWGIYNRFKSVFENERWGSELSEIDFCKVADGLGVDAVRVTSLDQLDSVLEQAIASGAPFVVEARVKYQLNPVNAYLGPATMPNVRLGKAVIAL